MEIFLCTSSQLKISDFKSCMQLPFKCISVDIEEIQGSPQEIATNKIESILRINKTPGIYITDDVSLSLHALSGNPGPYIKDFLKAGTKQISNIAKAVGNSATIICTLGVGIQTENFKLIKTFKGEINGKIIETENNNYKVFTEIFVPDGYTEHIGIVLEKYKISHRQMAIKKLVEFLIRLKDSEIFEFLSV